MNAFVALLLLSLSFLGSLVAAGPSPGPAPEVPSFPVDAVENRPKIQVGDRLVFKVHASSESLLTTGESLRVGTDEQDLKTQGWSIEPIAEGEGVNGELRFTIVPIRSGKLEVPSLPISGSNGSVLARTQPFSFDVESALSPQDPRQTLPPRPPVSLAFPLWQVIAVVVFTLALVGGVIYALYRWHASRKKPMRPPIVPPRPEDEVALLALEQLERQGYPARAEFKRHYFGVSEILKQYIALRYRVDAKESTSAELVLLLEEKKFVSESWLDQLEKLFSVLDRVKFTDHCPGPESAECVEVLSQARKFVKDTRRKPLTTETGGSAG